MGELIENEIYWIFFVVVKDKIFFDGRLIEIIFYQPVRFVLLVFPSYVKSSTLVNQARRFCFNGIARLH